MPHWKYICLKEGQSLVGSLLLFPGSWYTQGFACALQESVSPVLCKFWQLYGGVNGDLLQERLCNTQVCCTLSPCPCGRPLLTCTSTEDIQTQFWFSLCSSGVSGSCCIQGLCEPSKHLWWVWGLILNMISPLLQSRWDFFALECEVSFFFLSGIQHSPVGICSATNCNFEVLAGEDGCASFYSAIL